MSIMPWDRQSQTQWGMGPMGLPSGALGGGMNGALGILLGQGDPYPQQTQAPPPSQERRQPSHNIFGIRGKAGDILAQIGDALLVAGGKKPNYEENKRRWAMEETMRDYDPEDPMPTIRKMSMFDPEGAAKLLKEYRDWQNTKNQMDDRDADNTRQATDLSGKGRILIGSIAGTANPSTWAMAKREMDAVNKRYGVEMDIPTEYDENWISSTFNSAIDPKDKYTADSLERHRKFDRLDRVADNARQTAKDKEQARANRAREITSQRNAGVAERRADTYERTAGKPKGGSAKSSGLPSTFVGNKIRNKITGKVAVWNESKGKYE